MSIASTTAVDLSRLPAPQLIEAPDYESILSAMLARLQTLDPAFDALVESDPAMKILQVCAWFVLLERQRVNEAARGCMVAFAIGSDLDHLGALFGVARLEVTPADPESGAAAVMESDTSGRKIRSAVSFGRLGRISTGPSSMRPSCR